MAAHDKGDFTLQVDCVCVCVRARARAREREREREKERKRQTCLKWLKVVTVLQQCTVTEQHANMLLFALYGHRNIWPRIYLKMCFLCSDNCWSYKAVYIRVEKFAQGC